MINVQRRSSPTPVPRIEEQKPAPGSSGSTASRVVALFVQPEGSASPLRQRIESLLRYAVTDQQPSLAEQIVRQVQGAAEPLTDINLHNQVEQLLNQRSEVDPHKTYARLIHETLEGTTPAVNEPLLRPRRSLQQVTRSPGGRSNAIREFANALIDHGDAQLAMFVANSLVRQRLGNETGDAALKDDKVEIPPNSTFGQAWEELADALNSEPFKSFAEARKIDISKLFIEANGGLSEIRGNSVVKFHLHRDADWAASSAAVLKAARKVSSQSVGPVAYYDRNHAAAANIAAFYGLRLGAISSGDTLFAIGQLLRDRTFKAFTGHDPLNAAQYAPIKQRQTEAKQTVADLPAQQLNQRIAGLAASTVAQKVQDADRQLAQLAGLALIGQAPGVQDASEGFAPTLGDIPEYSTYHQVRKNLLAALRGEAFTAFAEENTIETDSVRIDPVSGTLTARVKGVETLFTLNDLSGWTMVWDNVKSAVQDMAAGSEADVKYPTEGPAPLYEVMDFYHENIPRQQDIRQKGWQQRQRLGLFNQGAGMSQNGFKALSTSLADDKLSSSVRQRQQNVIAQLATAPVPLSPLQTLAAAIESEDASQAEHTASAIETLNRADSELAMALHRVMPELKSTAPAKMIESIPTHSLFGQWLAYLDKALKGRGFTEWAQKQGIDLKTLRFDPADNALVASVKGTDRRFTAADFAKNHPDYFDVLAPVLSAANAFAAPGKPIELSRFTKTSAPAEAVCIFYGISTDYNSAAFTQSTALIGSTQAFPARPENPVRLVNWLARQKTALGDSNDRYALIEQLESGIINLDEDQGALRFVVDPDSSHQPKGMKTARAFIGENGWTVPQWKAESENLLRALRTPAPQAPALGNHWGFLATDLALDSAQRSQVIAHVKKSITPHNSLLDYLGQGVTSLAVDPRQALQQLLSSDDALALATGLQTEMKGAATTTSLQQWLLTAWVLELDSSAGTVRNTVAGFDFMSSDNWGMDVSTIRERFSQHLTANNKVAAHLAPIAARVLMAGTAPHLLVQGTPASITLGSPEWVSFVTAVNRIEHSAAGATANMTYQQVMSYHAISPLSAPEARVQALAQLNPVIDWAIINNHLVKSLTDEYSLEQLANSQEHLRKQIQEPTDARRYLRTIKPPSRRAMALAALKKQYGSGIDFEGRYLWEKVAGGIFSGIRASIVEVYEAGRLGEGWSSERPELNVEQLRGQAHKLPDINAQFDQAIEEDFALRRRHTLALFKDMLSKLPLQERLSLNEGAVEFLQVEGVGSGMVMTSIHKGVRRDFAVYPATGQIIRIADIAPATPRGQIVSLAIDAQAFKDGTVPKQHAKSDVVLRSSEQFILIPTNDGDKRPLLAERQFMERSSPLSSPYDSERMENLAKVLVDTTYLRKSAFVATHRGLNNAVENGVEPSDFFKSALRALPGGSSLIDIYHGEYIKAVGDLAVDIAIYAATEGIGKLWTVVKSGAAWGAVKISEKFIEKFGAQEAESILLKDVSAASTSKALSSLSRMQDSHLVEQAGDASVAAPNKAEGVVIRSGTQGQISVTAIMQNSKWYAYDAKTMAAYGPALDGFVSDTSSTLKQEIFSDGTKALVTEKSLGADAYTVTRTHGFDLINEGEVYRYDSRHPGVLRDLKSADYFKPLEGFEAICPAPGISGRVKRGANDTCFTKVIEEVSGELKQELQALEHVRLFPSAPKFLRKDQFVIFERRRWKMVDGEMGPTLHPVAETKPIAYKSKITGTLKNEPQFGFFNAQSSEGLERETRVVKLNRITEAVDDKRELRGVIVNGIGSTDKYLVIEADTAEFYYARLENAPGSELTFNKCTPRELPMVQAYRNKLSIRQGAANAPFDANFIALPKLRSAFEELERAGYLKKDIDQLKTACNELTEEQQREVVYQLQRAKAIHKADIALKPNRVVALKKPANFTSFTAEQQNKFYAQQAQNKVNSAMQATGLGPSNQMRSKADLARSDAAEMAIGWLRSTTNPRALNRSNLILKSGVGNCGEMSLLSKDIIEKSGGKAQEWYVNGGDHVFTVVGGPASAGKTTIDFLEDEWKDAWIVDPWAEISCKASEYTKLVKKKMSEWAAEGRQIYTNKKWRSPLDPQWIKALTTFEKKSY